VHFTWETSTSARVIAPVPTLLATHNRGNHGGIAPTQIGEPTPGKWTLLGTHNRGNHGGIAPTQIGEPTPVKWILSNRLRSVV